MVAKKMSGTACIEVYARSSSKQNAGSEADRVIYVSGDNKESAVDAV